MCIYLYNILYLIFNTFHGTSTRNVNKNEENSLFLYIRFILTGSKEKITSKIKFVKK